MSTLKLLLAEWREILAAVDESQGEISPEIESRMAIIEQNIPEKIDAYCYVMDKLEAESKFWKEKSEEAESISRKFASQGEYMKKRIKGYMAEHNLKELVGNESKFTLSKAVSSVTIYDSTHIPDQFIREVVTYVPDKKHLKEALEEGLEIAGCRLDGGAALRRMPNKKLLE